MPRIKVRLADSPEDILAAQRLRYQVFYEEWGAQPDADMQRENREIEAFDEVVDHLIVEDVGTGDDAPHVVGTYRLLRDDVAKQHGRFYSAQEFDIAPLLGSGARLLELGRSCVLAEYRTLPVLQLLWQGIAAYAADHQIELMFGCASFRGTDPKALAEPLSYLYHYHLAPDNLRPRALEDVHVDMNMMRKDDIDVPRARRALEPLIKGYLRLGADIGDGAFVDHQFNSVDVMIVMPTYKIKKKYADHYARTNQKEMLMDSDFSLRMEEELENI